MRRFDTLCRVDHSAGDMFRLVADVERYPEFVPLCTGLLIRDRLAAGDSEVLTCTMSVGYKAVQESFGCEVVLHAQAQEITVRYLSGPFRALDNRWRFLAQTSGACDVHFFIAYEFRNMAFQLLAGAVFDRAFGRFVEAFRERADQVYGAPPAVRTSIVKP
jgi:coenzyme Q-binding protein COQ10